MSKISNHAGELLDYQFHPGNNGNVLVIIGHGLTGNKDMPLLVGIAEGLAGRGWPCLRVSFSGNGRSGGRFVDSCITKQRGDLKALLDCLPDHVSAAYVGHGMGAAAGVLTARGDLRIHTVVSLAGMLKPADFAAREFAGLEPDGSCMMEDEKFPISSTLADDLKSIGCLLPVLARLVQPLLLIHGFDDELIPVGDSRDAAGIAGNRCELLEIPAVGHDFGEATFPLLITTIDRWLTAQLGDG